MRTVVMVFVVAGCNQIYGLDETKPADPIQPPDTDGDGVPDATDNCSAVANPDQFDSDEDSRGDRCDDCPLIANAPGNDFDDDGIGDACDPHPKAVNDCLLIVDTFADPALFAANWTTFGTDAANKFTPEPGHVSARVVAMGANIFMTANGTGPLADVIVRASNSPNDTTQVGALAAFTDKDTFYACSLEPPGTVRAVPVTNTPGKIIPTQAVTNDIVLRLILDRRTGQLAPDIFCRVDYGVSIGTNVSLTGVNLTGSSGLVVTGATSIGPSPVLTIDAVSITAPLAQCPPTSYR